MATDTVTATPTCDARVGEFAGDYGMLPLWCSTTVGLTSYEDAQGVTRRFCRHHGAVVRHRWPVATPRPDGCVVCKRPVIEELAISVEWHGRIGLVCHVCQERGDES